MDRKTLVHAAGAASPASTKVAADAESRARVQNKRRNGNKREFSVVTDLPERLPITEGELDLMERELSDFIAALLRR